MSQTLLTTGILNFGLPTTQRKQMLGNPPTLKDTNLSVYLFYSFGVLGLGSV
jgi:hypothetical protein